MNVDFFYQLGSRSLSRSSDGTYWYLLKLWSSQDNELKLSFWDRNCMSWPFSEDWGTSVGDFPSIFLHLFQFPLLSKSHLAFSSSHLLVHTSHPDGQDCFKPRLIWFELFRHIWIFILWAFSLRIFRSKVSYNKRIFRRILRRIEMTSMVNFRWLVISYFLFIKSIIIILASIRF